MSAVMLKSRMASRPASRRGAVSVTARSTGKTAGGKTISMKTSGVKTIAPGTGRDYALTLAGITEPFPNMFDPAGFTNNASVAEVRRWRESEIMHGRISMLAALGFIVGEQLEDFPAFFNYDGNITGPAIYQFSQVRQGFWEPLLIAIGLCETYRVALGWASPKGTGFNALKDDDEYMMGDLGFDPLGLKPEDDEELKALQTKELNNGRLAMIGISGFVAQELVLKQEIFEHLFLRFEEELILELDDIERDLGLPETPIPEIVLRELGQL